MNSSRNWERKRCRKYSGSPCSKTPTGQYHGSPERAVPAAVANRSVTTGTIQGWNMARLMIVLRMLFEA